MSAQYFIELNGATEGPFTLADLAAMRNAGTISETTLFAMPGAQTWNQVGSLFKPSVELPPMIVSDTRVPVGPKDFFCHSCRHAGSPARYTPGSFLIEVILWLFFLIPGLIYTIWRVTNKRYVCRVCGSPGIIPCSSPAAAQFVRISQP